MKAVVYHAPGAKVWEAVARAGRHGGQVSAGHAGPLVVDVRGLEKSYSGVPVVSGIDLAIGQGEVFALLGPNGAGKTTTVEILEGYRTRDRGEVSVLGVG